MKVAAGDKVAKNDPLLVMEAMKMESTVYAEHDGEIAEVLVKAKECVETRDFADGLQSSSGLQPDGCWHCTSR